MNRTMIDPNDPRWVRVNMDDAVRDLQQVRWIRIEAMRGIGKMPASEQQAPPKTIWDEIQDAMDRLERKARQHATVWACAVTHAAFNDQMSRNLDGLASGRLPQPVAEPWPWPKAPTLRDRIREAVEMWDGYDEDDLIAELTNIVEGE